MMYRQCILVNGKLMQTSFIPEPYCKAGNVLKLRGVGDEWVDGWIVQIAGRDLVEEPCVPPRRSEGRRLGT